MTNQDYDIRDFFPEDDVEGRLDAEKFMAELPMREKQIMYLYLCEHTQVEIGEMVGCSHQHVSRILANMCKSASKVAVDSETTYDK